MPWQYYNPNPKDNLVGDCVIRALTIALNEDWNKTYLEASIQGYEMKDMPSSNETWAMLLRRKGFKRYIIPNECPDCYTIEFTGNIAIPTGGTVTPIATAIVVQGESQQGSRSIYTPAAVDQYGKATSRTIVDVPKCCCFTVSVEYVSGVTDGTTVPTPTINVIDGSISIKRIA